MTTATEKTLWHVFGDGNWNEWYSSEEEGIAGFKKACKLYENVRLYVEAEDENGETVWEEYLDGKGDFPS